MADHDAEQWYPTAAYLYVLQLDDLALAWEYLRRNPEYRRDWRVRQRRPEAAQRWGLRLLEDPRLDARDAHPVWFPDHPALIHLYPDVDPMPDSVVFDFWRLPGSKSLVHDGRRLLLTTRWPGYCLRLTVAPGLEQGMAYVHAVRACARPCARYCALAAELDRLAVAADVAPLAAARCRPNPAALLELHTSKRSTPPWRGHPCARWLRGCSARRRWPTPGTPIAVCARRCVAWCGVAER